MPVERHRHGKAVVGRHFANDAKAMLASGNHAILPWHSATVEELAPHHVFEPARLASAHLPIRSGPQLVAKTVIKRLARVAIGRDWSADFDRYAAYDRIRSGATLDAALFTELTVNSQIPTDQWIDPASIALVDDPFLADFALRYTPKESADALPLVLAALENFARLEAKARAAAGPAG
jgi:hypothetical protein